MRMLLLLMLTASIPRSRRKPGGRAIIPRPAEDTRANSDAVPDVYAITGHFDRVVILRIKYNTDSARRP